MSGSHAELVPPTDGNYSIVDTDSRNGTFVGTIRLATGTPMTIVANALIQFGSASFYWVEPAMVQTLARTSR